MKQFKKVMRDIFTKNLGIKFLALVMAAVTVILINL